MGCTTSPCNGTPPSESFDIKLTHAQFHTGAIWKGILAMCLGTYVVSYSCGHTSYKNNVCLQDVDPHYRCEPRGMKITQPTGRCVECFARDLAPHQHLTTTVRFNPDPSVTIEAPQPLSARSSVSSSASERNDAIIKWYGLSGKL